MKNLAPNIYHQRAVVEGYAPKIITANKNLPII